MKIQWYPGHIAKAERQLKDQLKLVDVILEVRDARIPLSTYHPNMPEWIGNKGRVLIINRQDMIPPELIKMWRDWFKQRGENVYFANAQQGQGISNIIKAAQKAGEGMNKKRTDRGMLTRPVRAVVIGFPNVGKSALINRLLKKRVAESARKAGVTKSLRWFRMSETIELLDAPGVIPNRMTDQEDAIKLAICEDIGQASYDFQEIAIEFIELLQYLTATSDGLVTCKTLIDRYGLDPEKFTGVDYITELAKVIDQANTQRTARRIIDDFRKGLLGQIPLELPPL